MVNGLKFSPESCPSCESCILGKLTQESFRPMNSERANRPLELLYMNLCGPMPTASLGGSRYVYVIVDSFTRRIFSFFLRTKDEVFEKFIEFKNRRENELGSKIKAVRTYNGREFVNQKFLDLFKSNGIHHQRTVPYSPQSNGVAERANRTLLDQARTMLIDSSLPLEFWAEAISTATYLKNCSPTKICGDKTPIEKWTGNKPSVKHLMISGCLAYIFVTRPKRNKLQPKAIKGIFTGYLHKRKAYRIYVPQKDRIYEARTIKFDENQKGAILLTSLEYRPKKIMQLQYWTNTISSVNLPHFRLKTPIFIMTLVDRPT